MAVDLATIHQAMTTLEAQGEPLSAQAVWRTLQAQGLQVRRTTVQQRYKEALAQRQPGAAPSAAPAVGRPLARLAAAEAALQEAAAQLARANGVAEEWTQRASMLEQRLQRGTLAEQDPYIPQTQAAFGQARAQYGQAWHAYVAAQEQVEQARESVRAAQRQTEEAWRTAWVAEQRPALIEAVWAAEQALSAARAQADWRAVHIGKNTLWRAKQALVAAMADAPEAAEEERPHATTVHA